jgi:hypothetical protein
MYGPPLPPGFAPPGFAPPGAGAPGAALAGSAGSEGGAAAAVPGAERVP